MIVIKIFHFDGASKFDEKFLQSGKTNIVFPHQAWINPYYSKGSFHFQNETNFDQH